MNYLGFMNLPAAEEILITRVEFISSNATEQELVAVIKKYDEALKEALTHINLNQIDETYWAVLPTVVDEKEKPGIMKKIWDLQEEAKATALNIKTIMDKPIQLDFGDVNGTKNIRDTV